MKIKFILKEGKYTPEGKGKYKFIIGEKVRVLLMPGLDVGEVHDVRRRLFENWYSVHFPSRKYPRKDTIDFSEYYLERVAHASSVEELLAQSIR